MENFPDLEAIPSQIGTGIIRIQDKSVLKITGNIDQAKMATVLEIFRNSNRSFTLEEGFVSDMTIESDGAAYRISSDGINVYAVLIKIEGK